MTAGRKGTWSDGGTDGELLAGTADRLRWRAPELTLVFARQAATHADEAKDRSLALRANALMVAALVRLGKHAEAVEPAVAALREAETAGDRDLAGSVRVDLAASTRAVGLTGSAFVLVRPMLEGSDTRPAVRAGALAEIVGGLAQAGRLDVIDEVLSEADRLYAADEMLSGDVRRIMRALLYARIASFRRRWGNATGAVAAATEGLTLLDGLSDPGTDSGQARAELGLEMVSALLDAGEEAAAVGQADQTLSQPVRATSAAAIGRLMLILATRVHFPAGRAREAHALLAEIVRVARRHELDGLLADVLTSLAHAQEADGDLTDALNSLRSARAAEQRRLRADTLARLIVLEELGAGTRLPDDTESLLRRVVRTPARSIPEAAGTELSAREAASREMSGRELAGRGIGPGPRPRPTRGAGTYDSVGYERTGQGTEGYDAAATASQDYDAAASQSASEGYGLASQGYSVTYDLEGYPTLTTTAGYDLAASLGLNDDADSGTAGRRGRSIASTGETAGTGTGAGVGFGSGAGIAGGGGEGGGGGAPGTSGLAASGSGGSSMGRSGTHDLLGRELAGWEMVARERAAMDLAGQTRAGSDLVDADRAAPEWAGADPAAVDRVVGRAAVDRAAVDMHAEDSEPVDMAETVESESEWAATAVAGSTSEQSSRPKGRRAADSDKPKWPDASQNERDEETGLLNRQGLRRRLAAARRQARPTALTLVRLEPSGDEPEPEPRRKDPDSTDRFSAALIKAIDTAGVGRIPPEIDPDVLTSLADHVRDMAPRDAELARPEEGELAVLLPDTTRDEAEQFAATLRETVSTSDWDVEDPARGVNVSTGVAQYQEGTSEDALLSAAREALTHNEQEHDQPDWQSVEPLYDLPPEDSGYTFIQEYAGLSSDVADPEMAEYLAGFPLPDYGSQWPAADERGMPQDDSVDAEGGRSVLDRLDISRGSGGRRRAPDAFKADQLSEYDQYAIDQPMKTYSSTGDEILAAAEEGERASIPQPPDPDEIPTPPDSPEVPIPPDPDVEPQPGRRRRPTEPDEPAEDPEHRPNPRPRFPIGPDIPAPDDPDADPDPQRRRWTSELDPENPRARRRALPRDPSRRATEPDDNPETTGRRRMPDANETETPAASTRPGESTGRRRMPEPFEEPELSTRIEAPKPEVGQTTGRRRMPEWPNESESEPENPESRRAQGESTGRRRMPDIWPTEPEPTGRRRMPEQEPEPGRRRKPEPLPEKEPEKESVGRETPSAPERTGRRWKPDAQDPGDPGSRRNPDVADLAGLGVGRKPASEDLGDLGSRRNSDLRDLAGVSGRGKPDPEDLAGLGGRGGPDVKDVAGFGGRRKSDADDAVGFGGRRKPDPDDLAGRGKSDLDDLAALGGRRKSDAEAPSDGGRRRKPDAEDVADFGLRWKPTEPSGPGESEGHSGPSGNAFPEASTGRRRMPESLRSQGGSLDVPGDHEMPRRRGMPDQASSGAVDRREMPLPSDTAGGREVSGPSGTVGGWEVSSVGDPVGGLEMLSSGDTAGRREIPPHSESAGRRRMPQPQGGEEEPTGSRPPESRAIGEKTRPNISESLGLDAILGETSFGSPDAWGTRAQRSHPGYPGAESVSDEVAGRRTHGPDISHERSAESPGMDATSSGAPRAQTDRGRRGDLEADQQVDTGGRFAGPETVSNELVRESLGLEAILGEDTARNAPTTRISRGRSDASSVRDAILGLAGSGESSVDRVGEETRPGRRRASEPDTAAPAPPPQRQQPAAAVPSAAALPPEQSGPVDVARPAVFSLGPEGLSRRPSPSGAATGVASDAGTEKATGTQKATGSEKAIGTEKATGEDAVTESGVSKNTEPVEKTIQPDESSMARRLSSSGVDELSKRRLTEGRPERPRRRTERAADEAGDDRPSRLRRRERTDLKLADLLAEALVAYQSSTSDAPDEDVLSAYEGLEAATGEDTDRHRGETGY
ncbi:diguanylate cyclase [Kibdelosporangium philippinense]|uniref:Diguanylate cyclase n=1 Tax=Kibdelosporangium philippinense TaxID=211113 RepID=A0ABS8ZI79_9PSEU|nr:diguanylate cyclase [Kibdelosporangium philippinense]MCE7007519.1 diguanylate cyclase [Kibdelosporangium philippinense]